MSDRSKKEKLLKLFGNISLIGYPIFLLFNWIHFSIFNRNKYKNGLSGMLRVYNECEYIDKCINSCIDALDELIVYDNGSSDGTYEKLIELSKKNSKIKVFQYTNREGWYIKKLCQKTLNKTTYKYVMKIDSDQIYRTDYLNDIKNKITNDNNSIFLLSGVNLFTNKYGDYCWPSKVKINYMKSINGFLDTAIFKKTIFTKFIKHKIDGGKYEFQYIPFMATIVRPFRYYNHLIWLHLRYIKSNDKFEEWTNIEDLNKIQQDFFNIDDYSWLKYYENFALVKINNNYYINESILKDIKYWYNYANKHIK